MTVTDTRFAALFATIDADPTNPEPVAILGDWFEDHGDARAGCIQWAMRWGRVPVWNDCSGYYFTAVDDTNYFCVLDCFSGGIFVPDRSVFRASEAWIALCDRWAEMTADEREMVERESERVWGGK